jgi:hypothetical protein
MTTHCELCGNEFKARRATARFCSSSCRSKARRRTEPAGPDPDSALVDAVRRELDEAGCLDTVDGQIALQLARKMSTQTGKDLVGLVAELRNVLVRARSSAGGPDEVQRARHLREEKRRALGLDEP